LYDYAAKTEGMLHILIQLFNFK